MSESSGKVFPEQLPSVWQSLDISARSWPDKLAIACLHQKADAYGISRKFKDARYLRWTYAELNTAVNSFASNLQRLGIGRGKVIATFLPNCIEYVIIFWAAHKLGCTFVPINPRSLLNVQETTRMLQIANASVVVVENQHAATAIDNIEVESPTKISLSNVPGSWLCFDHLMTPTEHQIAVNPLGIVDQTALVTILFTSGTTSMSKGCPHTDRTLNAFMANLALGGSSETDIFCSVLPNNHAMGYFYCLYHFCHGGAVVYPGPGFDAATMLHALVVEECTHTCLVPTTLHALLDAYISSSAPPELHLKDVCLAGSSVSAANMRQVTDVLKSQGVSTGFGMTEGSPVWTGYKVHPDDLIRGSAVLSGEASPGATIRVCAPNSRQIVSRGQEGEIHQTGPGLINGYIGLDSDMFYHDDEGRRWFLTGDQAIMYEDGMISITGRYKDMIIRGGENIAPASIEAVLNTVDDVQAQVVGIPDEIAGEVPIAVVGQISKQAVSTLRDAVLQKMGPAFVPERVLTLQELGLDDFPRTTSGKVQKSTLAKVVHQFIEQDATQNGDSSHIAATVLTAWHKATGIPRECLDQTAPTTVFADSIAVMRVRDTIRKQLAISILAEEMVDHPSIKSQINLLSVKTPRIKREVTHAQVKVQHAVKPDLMIMFDGTDAEYMKTMITQKLALKGFDWLEDVAEIIPATDFMGVLLEAGIIDTWNFGIAVIADGSTKKEYRAALEKALSNSPVMTSFVVVDKQSRPYYVTLKPTQKLWDMSIIDYGSVPKAEDVQRLAMEYPFPDHARLPGPLFRCILVHVEEINSSAMVMYVHHIVHDASLMRLVYEDIEEALTNPKKPLRQHMPFKAWADTYQALRYSPSANVSVNYHVNRLRNLHLHKRAFYPPARAPRCAIQETPDGLDYGFEASGLTELKTKHPHIIASTVLKAAMALVEVQRTGYTHAIFNNFEACRDKFPFLPHSLQALNPDVYEAADVNGPIMAGVTNLIEVNRNQTAISLLEYLQHEQSELTKHAHAPLRRVIDALNADSTGAGDMIMETQRTHFLTWIPGFLGDYNKIRVAQIAIRCIAGLVVVAGIGGPNATTYMFSMRWDVANYSRGETQTYVEDLQKAVVWLTTRMNWETPLGEYLTPTAITTPVAPDARSDDDVLQKIASYVSAKEFV